MNMDDLDNQLAQLKLLNNRDLSPKPHGLVKKVGPAVPPKPKKLQPQAQTVASSRNLYSNMKMTLDNPAVLEQQLEALEHHKKVLENQQKRRMQNAGYMSASHSPPPKSFNSNGGGNIAVGIGGGGKIYENQQMLYENMKSNEHQYPRNSNAGASHYNNTFHDKKNNSELIYSNILHGGESGGGVAVGIPRNGMPKQDLTNPYSNMSYDPNELPPPPLDIPPPLNLVDGDYLQTSEEDLPPPPSPVSSSYSELRRATDNSFPTMPTYPSQNYQHLNHQMGAGMNATGGLVGTSNITNDIIHQTYANSYQPDYGTYVPSSQSSSTYESIYEPINPRPPSQMSSRSNYSLYTPYVSGPQGTGLNSSKLPSHKEAEVDVLTDLLVQSMDNQDIDSYGICVTCGERVVGESSGCTAMEQIYHIECFTCCQCQINLQGKPFYALDGKPCCEDDYLNTLEKCSVCMKPILERILRATGKPYHPGCFCCVVCGKSLDGVPFTVDATNQNHCIEDFHKKFAPRCCVCRQPIMPEPGKEETVRVVALDRSFHVACYKCEDCGLLLSSEAEGRGCFPLDDHILCKSCNAKRVQALTSHMTTEL